MVMIMMAVAMLIFTWMQPKQKQEPARPPEAGTQRPPKPGKVKPSPKVNPEDIGGPAEPVHRIELTTQEMRLVICSQGAGIEKLELRQHHPSAEEGDKPLEILDMHILKRGLNREELARRKLPARRSMVLTGVSNRQDFENWNWKLSAINGKAVATDDVPGKVDVEKPFRLEFRARRGEFEIVKTYTVYPAGFDLDLAVVVVNHADDVKQVKYRLVGPAGVILDEPASRYSSITAMLAGRDDPRAGVSTHTVAATKAAGYWNEKDWEELELSKSHTEWAALRGRYFSAILYPESPGQVINAFAEPLDPAEKDEGRANLAVGLKINDRTIDAGTKLTRLFHLRVGPQRLEQLEGYEYTVDGGKTKVNREMVQSIDFGWSWFAWLSRFFLKMLQLIHVVVPNYGVCIILLTLCVKLALHPISLKGQRSMQRMQELQPKIQAMQKQFKKDPQKMQQAQMRLFKEEGVNPASGCLPLFLQMPIFIGLYGAIRGTFEFRQEAFLWISDLSRPDMLFTVGFWPHQLNLLPVIYAGLMIAQSSLQPLPKEGQARQTAMMMRFMPLVFFFIIYSMPSAFVLYFAASSIIGFVEGRIIKRQLARAKEAREAAAAGGVALSAAVEKGESQPDPKAFWKAEAEARKKGKKKR